MLKGEEGERAVVGVTTLNEASGFIGVGPWVGEEIPTGIEIWQHCEIGLVHDVVGRACIGEHLGDFLSIVAKRLV